MSMIEKAARALAGHFGPDEYDELPKDKAQLREWRRTGYQYDISQEDLREAFAGGLRSIREPSEEMIEAAKNARMVCPEGTPPGAVFNHAWMAMLDTIIGDAGGATK